MWGTCKGKATDLRQWMVLGNVYVVRKDDSFNFESRGCEMNRRKNDSCLEKLEGQLKTLDDVYRKLKTYLLKVVKFSQLFL